MLTLLGSLLGFAGSTVPAVFNHIQKKEQNKKEIEVMKMQAELAKQNADIDLMKFNSMAIDNEHQRLIAHDIAIQQSNGPLSSLSKSVRPVITYLFFTLFAAVKISALIIAIDNTDNLNAAMQIVWDEETQAMFAAIISFWFGSRALEKRTFR